MKRLFLATAVLGSLTACGSTSSTPGPSWSPTGSATTSNSLVFPTPTSADVVNFEASVFLIRGATTCGFGIANTGFLIGRHTIMTNAHAVEGVTQPLVIDGAKTLPARVIAYDPDKDVAVLSASELNGSPLVFDSTALNGESVAVLVHPHNGPLRLQAGRVTSETHLRGPNIYGSGTVLRSVYELAANIQPGDSGGPVVDIFGHVVGVVFAASEKHSGVGYALTTSVVAPFLKYAGAAPNGQQWPTVSSGHCVPRP